MESREQIWVGFMQVKCLGIESKAEMGISLAVGIRGKDSGMDMQGQGQASWPGAGFQFRQLGCQEIYLGIGVLGKGSEVNFGHVVSERCIMSKLEVQYSPLGL